MSTSRFRVVHISDTHLAEDVRPFVWNFQAAVALIRARRPDLVVNTGDVTLDGAHRPHDLTFARDCHEELDAPWVCIPGNHDIGDNPWKTDLGDPITDERLGLYRRTFGEDWWIVDAGAWMLLGVNAQLLGSGLADEDTQWAFIESAVARSAGRPVAVFVHKPLFRDHADETGIDGRYVPPAPRRRLAQALHGADVRLVASGHVHQHRRHRVQGIEHAWAPSTAFVLPDSRQPRIGVKRVGFLIYTFDATDVRIEIVEPPELTNHDRDDFPDLYAAHR